MHHTLTHSITPPAPSLPSSPFPIPQRRAGWTHKRPSAFSLEVVTALFFSCVCLSFGSQSKGKRMFSSPALTRGTFPKELKSSYLSSSPPAQHPGITHLGERSISLAARDERGSNKRQGFASHICVPPTGHIPSYSDPSTQEAAAHPSLASTNEQDS